MCAGQRRRWPHLRHRHQVNARNKTALSASWTSKKKPRGATPHSVTEPRGARHMSAPSEKVDGSPITISVKTLDARVLKVQIDRNVRNRAHYDGVC